MKVVGFHFIITAYGFWLPNDPRGSWSKTVRQLDLLTSGRATTTHATHSLATKPHDESARRAAKRQLKYPPVVLTGNQARQAARGVAEAADETGYRIHALAVLPNHLHMVTGFHGRPPEEIAAHIKARMTRQMTLAGCHPMVAHARKGRVPSPWARHHWCSFIRDETHMRAAIEYVEANPVKAGLKRQRWSVVGPFGS